MEKINDVNNYNNYSILSTNLTNDSQRIKNINRMSSPVLIQSYGNNNLVVEVKYNKIRNNNYDDYDFFENEMQKTRPNKAYTTYSQISNDDRNFFISQMIQPGQKYYNNYTNYQNNYNINNYNHNNILLNEDIHNKTNYPKYNYKIFKRQEINALFIPAEKICISPQKIHNIYFNNNNELKYQRFGASFISKSPDSNNTSYRKRFFQKRQIINNNRVINSNRNKGEENQRSKSKNQLQDFNLDKLKEIGDNIALKYINKINQQNNINSHNNINDIKIIPENKEQKNDFINKILKIEQKRKESKNKIKYNLIKKNESKNISCSPNRNINLDDNNKKIENKYIKYNNYLDYQTNLKKINKSELKLKMSRSPSPSSSPKTGNKKIQIINKYIKNSPNIKANNVENKIILQNYKENKYYNSPPDVNIKNNQKEINKRIYINKKYEKRKVFSMEKRKENKDVNTNFNNHKFVETKHINSPRQKI